MLEQGMLRLQALHSSPFFLAVLLLPTALLAGKIESDPDPWRPAAAEIMRGAPAEALALVPGCDGPKSGEIDAARLLSWRLFLLAGRALVEGGDLDLAERALTEVGACGSTEELPLRLAAALAMRGEVERALKLLASTEASTAPARPEALALEAALLERSGRPEAARALHLRLLLEHPEHPAALESGGRLLDLSIPKDRMPSDEERILRLEKLSAANLNDEAIAAAQRLIPLFEVGGHSWCRSTLALGGAHRKARNYREAIESLGALIEVCDQDRLVQEAWWLRASATWILEGDPAIELFRDYADRWPEDPDAERALYFIAALHHRARRFEEARAVLAEQLETWPSGPQSASAMWRSFWLSWQQERPAEALPMLERLEERGREPGQRFHLERALYWKARVLAREGREEEAVPILEALVRDHPLSYYWLHAKQRLAMLQPGLAEAVAASLPQPTEEASPSMAFLSGTEVVEIVAGRTLLELGLAKDAAALFRMARGDARTAEREDLIGLALLMSLAGDAHSSHWLIRTRGGGFDNEWPQGPHTALWRAAYPLAWPCEVRSAASEAGIDPLLLHALIREESALLPEVVSWAGAVGLAQMMPRTAADVASQLGIEAGEDREWLKDPETNLRVAARRLSDLLLLFGGNPALAIAAYNAGERTVMSWLLEADGAPLDEFVESIRIAETQRYTRRVLRSWATYRWLHGEGEERILILPPTVSVP